MITVHKHIQFGLLTGFVLAWAAVGIAFASQPVFEQMMAQVRLETYEHSK